MPDLDPITRLNAALEGRYRIESQLGEGGMATVYLADDLRHERKVALKVLKPELAAVVGAERFLAEIKTTANLQHPHILPLFDSGEADTFLFYVMPYVEGETLREKLDREHQLPVEEAVRITTEVAEALQAAHEQGVVHRDIKPANILLSRGRPLVADFGIALAVNAAGGGRLTETGLSLGTPHYMSPEQATGDLSVGAAADVYALGCVLYEMLVGEPPYTGSTAQAILGKIISGKVASATEHRASIPPNVDAAITKSLEKLPADRFLGAQDLARALADPGFQHGEPATIAVGGRPGPWKAIAMATSVVAVLALGGFATSLSRGPDASPKPVVRFTMPVGEGADVYLGGAGDTRWGRPSLPSLAIAPGGDFIVYTAWEQLPDGDVVARLYRRRFDQERADPIEGTEGAFGPFFSPDGAWVGFAVDSLLQRLSMVDGSIETIARDVPVLPGSFKATWGDDDTIVYFGGELTLYRVSANGGRSEMVVRPASGALFHPQFLPGSRKLLAVHGRSYNPDEIDVVLLDLEAGSQTLLVPAANDPRYVDSGHLLFMRHGTLMAVGFDPNLGELRGEPIVVLDDVMHAQGMPNTDVESFVGHFAISREGHIAYASGGVYPARPRELMRVRFDGIAEPVGLPAREYGKIRVSPEGEQIAFSVRNGRASSIFVYDLARRTTEPLATGGFNSDIAEWSPDGREIAVTGGGNYRMTVDGSGSPQPLFPPETGGRPVSWSSEGVIAYLRGGDIWIQASERDNAPFFTSASAETFVTFSPDGRWLAYVSDQTGRSEVYVRPYPGPGAATLVSVEGGFAPTWSPDGRRLFFLARDSDGLAMMVSEIVVAGDELRAGPPAVLIEPWPYVTEVPTRSYDVLDDGSFVASLNQDGGDFRTQFKVEEVHVIMNFVDELRARVPN
ncbi:MAG: protein kinase [Gemmatimonadota bacterium]|nr:protein kinase [Gemmatimonadota bacterium]